MVQINAFDGSDGFTVNKTGLQWNATYGFGGWLGKTQHSLDNSFVSRTFFPSKSGIAMKPPKNRNICGTCVFTSSRTTMRPFSPPGRSFRLTICANLTACDWWHGNPQLFWAYSYLPIQRPCSCSTVDLEVIAA